MEQNNEQRNSHVEDAPKFGEDEKAATDAFAQHAMIQGDMNGYNRREFDEEYAQEMTAGGFNEPITTDPETKQRAEVDSKTGFGWFGVVMAIASFFILPVFFSIGGIILGFMAKRNGADILGNTAIIAGALSFIITLFIVPMV
ncbi:hypothetical protein Pryu01_00557 [Paraliobacillus ryukyuensis]|uniref:DUF4190 domain-containing protein n=1 Tax=Paraliobacillus ryukyuensis TaxID=200904 RepID=A0A366EG59_9BACI|nr:hypothetical protein [Paraliobacillus ryukyuensis]RBP01377.1 hypothetical protein DES48_101107 [Paraliobacillus ryukyuensis]